MEVVDLCCAVFVLMSTSGEARSGLKRQPTRLDDPQGAYIAITYGSISGQLFFDKCKRSQGKCVLVGGRWLTPTEVESLAGKKAKKWKKSLLHLGRPLSEFNLSTQPSQGSQCLQPNTLPGYAWWRKNLW